MPNDEDMTSDLSYNTDRAHREKKAVRITAACDSGDIPELAALSTSEHGFVNDGIRRIAWPVLLGCHEGTNIGKNSDWTALPNHRDEDQVRLDVDRAFVYYPNGQL